MTPSTRMRRSRRLRVVVTAGIGDFRFPDRSADLHGIITGDVLGILSRASGRSAAKQPGHAPGWLYRRDRCSRTVYPGHRRCAVPVDQALANAAGIGTLPEDVKMIWYCGGHGVCLTMNQSQLDDQETFLRDNTSPSSALLEGRRHRRDAEIPVRRPTRQVAHGGRPSQRRRLLWRHRADQDSPGKWRRSWHRADPRGYRTAVGSRIPGFARPRYAGENPITVPIEPESQTGTTYVVGLPHLEFDYSGVGTTRHVYAQIVDKKTGLVVGNIVTPVSVTFDGGPGGQSRHGEHRVDVPNATGIEGHPSNYNDLELQIVSSARPMRTSPRSVSSTSAT